MAGRAQLGHIPIALVLVLAGVAYTKDLGNSLFGSDTWPWLVSTRVTGVGDVLRVAFSPIMSGTRFVTEVALFYHPLTALSYSLDQVVFGLNPVPYYATNLLIHLAAVSALYLFARALGASRWAGCASALILGLHPVARATVPSLPRRQDLVVAVLLLGSMTLLVRSGTGQTHMRKRALAGALTVFFLALGGKESAYAGLVIVPLIVAATRRSLLVVLGFLLLTAVAFGIRWRVLGGLGGYYGSAAVLGNSQGVVEFFLRPYITYVVWPFHSVLPDRLRDWLLLMGLVAVVRGVAIAGFPARRRWMAAIGVVWQAAFLGLYAVVHTSLSAYLVYVPLAGMALLVAALLDGAADGLKSGRVRLTNVCAGLAAAGAVVLVVGVLRTSALLTDYPEFRDASNISQQFIDQAIPCLAAAPAGAVVTIDGLPHRIDYASAESQFVDAYMFEPYSIESVVRLLVPDTRAQVTLRSSQDIQIRPPEIAVTCSHTGNDWQITARLPTR